MVTKPLIYLASPYSDPDPGVRQKRYEEATRHASILMTEMDIYVFSPITHSHNLEQLEKRDWQFWMKFSCNLLAKCDELFILKIPGWNESKGVFMERHIAKMLKMPITEIEPYLDNIVDKDLKKFPEL